MGGNRGEGVGSCADGHTQETASSVGGCHHDDFDSGRKWLTFHTHIFTSLRPSLSPSLLLHPSPSIGQYCLETRGDAVFNNGACDGKRTTQEQVMALPMGEASYLKPVRLVAGIASNEFAPVVITKPFLLRGR